MALKNHKIDFLLLNMTDFPLKLGAGTILMNVKSLRRILRANRTKLSFEVLYTSTSQYAQSKKAQNYQKAVKKV